MSSLVIVESPGKVKTIQKYLDSLFPNRFRVMASVGHICDLPPKDMGFKFPDFDPLYVVYPEKKKVVSDLKNAVRNSDEVILATDDDREGEAIAFHLQRELALKNPDRIKFNEITKAALEIALKNPNKIDQKMVDSQETRRMLDRMIGWMVSPVANTLVVPDSSMGRVQSAVLKLLEDHERSIRNFVEVNHFGVTSYFDGNWYAEWDTKNWRKEDEAYWLDEPSAQKVADIKKLKVTKSVDGTANRQPPAPFITSSLQRAAQKTLKLTPKETMEIAQKLYEAGAITYMRTDNPNLSDTAYVALKKYALDNDLPIESTQRMFKTKESAQQAHEAVRPTSFALRNVGEGKIQALYDLIWYRTVACQLAAARFNTKEVSLEAVVNVNIDGRIEDRLAKFSARGRTLVYKGWTGLTDQDLTEDEEKEAEPNNPIPETVREGDTVEVVLGKLNAKKTAPPNRYTSSSLIAKIEATGIGRPSTYATIIDTLEKRAYIKYDAKQKIFVTEKGRTIIDRMEDSFQFIDVLYTAEMEERLDLVASGGKQSKPVLREFFQGLTAEVNAFKQREYAKLPQIFCTCCDLKSLVILTRTPKGDFWRCTNSDCRTVYEYDGTNNLGKPNITKTTEFKCLECQRPLVYRSGSYQGRSYEYFQCSGGRETTPCSAKYTLMENKTPDFEKYKELNKYKCKTCNRPVVQRFRKLPDGTPDNSKPFWMCSGNRKENALCTEFYEDKNNAPDFDLYDLNHIHKCLECSSFLELRKNDNGAYWSCAGRKKERKPCILTYPDLNNSPDFEKFKSINQYKCTHCGNFLKEDVDKTTQEKVWKCTGWRARPSCRLKFFDLNGKPDFDLGLSMYKHKCKCKRPLVSKISRKDGSKFWSCTGYPDCNHSYPDKSGEPDLEFKPAPKSKGKK